MSLNKLVKKLLQNCVKTWLQFLKIDRTILTFLYLNKELFFTDGLTLIREKSLAFNNCYNFINSAFYYLLLILDLLRVAKPVKTYVRKKQGWQSYKVTGSLSLCKLPKYIGHQLALTFSLFVCLCSHCFLVFGPK